MPTPHDALFKLTFSDPARAAALLRTALPPALAERIDWDTLERLPTHFITELRARQTDLLFRVRLRGHEGREARLVLLFEHASQSDDWLVLRAVEYTFLILKDYLREHPKTHLLPAVVPSSCIIVSAGGPAPSSSTSSSTSRAVSSRSSRPTCSITASSSMI